MNILVCIKQVLESGSDVKISASEKQVHLSDSTRFEINKYDEYAVEEAIQIKEQLGENCRVHVITVGPERAADVLRRALGMGADDGIHILDSAPDYRPPARTAAWIARYVRDKTYDLILTGIMSDDEMNAQTGPMIAQMLNLPCASAVIKTTLAEDQHTIAIEREIEGGEKDMFDVALPCVLAIQTGINSPRYPSLSKVLRAKKKVFEIIHPDNETDASPEPELLRLETPQKTGTGLFLNGSTEEKAEQLMDILASKALT